MGDPALDGESEKTECLKIAMGVLTLDLPLDPPPRPSLIGATMKDTFLPGYLSPYLSLMLFISHF